MFKEKLVLDYSEEEFLLYGIISDVKEYKLAWQLNKLMGVNFIMQEELELDFKRDKKLFISFYLSKHEFYKVKLIKNKAEDSEGIKSAFILPEHKNFDYLLLVEGEDFNSFEEEKKLEKAKEASFVQYISEINIENLKSLDNLMF